MLIECPKDQIPKRDIYKFNNESIIETDCYRDWLTWWLIDGDRQNESWIERVFDRTTDRRTPHQLKETPIDWLDKSQTERHKGTKTDGLKGRWTEIIWQEDNSSNWANRYMSKWQWKRPLKFWVGIIHTIIGISDLPWKIIHESTTNWSINHRLQFPNTDPRSFPIVRRRLFFVTILRKFEEGEEEGKKEKMKWWWSYRGLRSMSSLGVGEMHFSQQIKLQMKEMS